MALALATSLDTLVAGGVVGSVTFQLSLPAGNTGQLRSRALLLEVFSIRELIQRVVGGVRSRRDALAGVSGALRHD